MLNDSTLGIIASVNNFKKKSHLPVLYFCVLKCSPILDWVKNKIRKKWLFNLMLLFYTCVYYMEERTKGPSIERSLWKNCYFKKVSLNFWRGYEEQDKAELLYLPHHTPCPCRQRPKEGRGLTVTLEKLWGLAENIHLSTICLSQLLIHLSAVHGKRQF